MEYVAFSSIVEENGKTIRENNLEQRHKYPIGSLVECKLSTWHGDGACEKIHARLWVVEHTRDCDGSPLYNLSGTKLINQNQPKTEIAITLDGKDYLWTLEEDSARHKFYGSHCNIGEDSLTLIEITPDIMYGKGALDWELDELN